MATFDMHGTDAEDVAREKMQNARESLNRLRSWLDRMEDAMENRRDGAFPIAWCETMMQHALAICNEVARANGAVLVRAVEPADGGAS